MQGLAGLALPALSSPPVGSISASTHPLPIQLTVTLQNIDLAVLRTVVFSTPECSGGHRYSGRMGGRILMAYLRLVALGLWERWWGCGSRG